MQVPSEIVGKWQEIVNLLAEIMHVPSALVMKVEPPNIMVFVSSESKGNPYEQDEVSSLNTGLYCETVMKTRQPLLVPDALLEEEWKSNPDIKLGMISYLGFPIAWPDGRIFGTICVLDNKRNEYSEPYRKLLLQFREVLQADLRWLTELGGELATQKVHLKRAEAKLCQDEEELRRMTDAIPQTIIVLNTNGTVPDRLFSRASRTRWTSSGWKTRARKSSARTSSRDSPMYSSATRFAQITLPSGFRTTIVSATASIILRSSSSDLRIVSRALRSASCDRWRSIAISARRPAASIRARSASVGKRDSAE